MIKCVKCAALPVALGQLKNLIAQNEEAKVRTVIFCEDRLSLAAERTVCSAVEGTFCTSVYTFARFLAAECGKPARVLSSQGSAMVVRRIIEERRGQLSLFKQLSAPSAAQAVYDTIALLYSSRISAEELEKAAAYGGLLGGKLKDISLIYSEYMRYLESNGLQDRNGYLKRLAPLIENSEKVKGASVVFLGFQAFTRTVTECVRAAFASAKDVTGLFIGGSEDIYVNEAWPAFVAAAEEFGGACKSEAECKLPREADILRRALFDPETFYKKAESTDKVYIFEANDSQSEFEFIAASIKRHVLDEGERYSEISVMMPDLAENERILSRVFSRYRIPYYADRRIPLSEHPLCAFIFAYANCILSGCRPQDTDAVISSPYFPAEQADKDIFRNYALKFAAYRGGVFKAPAEGIAESFGYDIGAIERVRALFAEGYSILTQKDGSIFGNIRSLLSGFGAERKLQELSETFKQSHPVQSAFGARAYGGILQVLEEAEELCGDMPLKDILKILKSGFAATEISLIPPKADAVFVGDISATANTGSNVVFAAGLTGDVPSSGADTALLTDREISRLEQLKLDISPKIRQVNLRVRETTALNVCAFKKRLYLSYPSRQGGGESGVSEIISYASAAFLTKSGAKLVPFDIKRLEKKGSALPYYASEKLPAIASLEKLKTRPAAFSAVYSALVRNGFKEEADAALKKPAAHGLSCARQLYVSYDSITPTALETYFLCPYMGYMRQGLKVQEREEGAVRPVDSGNFIHAVLEEIAPEVNSISEISELRERARAVAGRKLSAPPYSSLAQSKSGEYTANALKEEAVKVCEGMFEQIKNSRFKVSSAETKCEINLLPGVKIFGRIDRLDECGELVRIIDYKTGTIDCSPAKYYTGAKLQLPLYLLAASGGGRRAAGAYYFPASLEYREKEDGVFRLQGYMDGSAEVVSASDVTLKPKQKSAYFDAYLNGRELDTAMSAEDFRYFLDYSRMVAGKGAGEMLSGNTSPSPAEDACKFCKMGGSCGFAAGRDGGERKPPKINCAAIAEIAREKGGNND